MRRHRRAVTVLIAALSLLYLYTLRWDLGWSARARAGRDGGDVRNGTLGFGAIFVINLPSRRDRREAMGMAGEVSNLNLTFIEGFTGDSGLPDTKEGRARARSGSAGARGSWRSHVAALQMIVDRGLSSALVLEDDVDWDVRLGAQMETLAAASRAWLNIEEERRWAAASRPARKVTRVSASRGAAERPARPGPDPESGDGKERDEEEGEEGPGRDTIPLSPALIAEAVRGGAGSPYGEGWDVLWLGHCGADLPAAIATTTTPSSSSSPILSSLEIAVLDDVTVPAPKHLKPHPFALCDKLAGAYPAHTRVVHAARGNACSLAYAVSSAGARALLRRFRGGGGVKGGREGEGEGEGFVDQWDLALRDYCMGGGDDEADDHDHGGKGGLLLGRRRRGLVCLTVQPPLFSHRYAGDAGGASVSDIRGQGGGFARGKKGTPYVRLSVQANLGRLVAGAAVDGLVDQLPDEGDALW
ncbi:hypothetical protein F4802DRAFT_616205 [Xylaria palmicola]|nr:hypothetical protein F4802DRAFT_616205 [Xylaria palmicola]